MASGGHIFTLRLLQNKHSENEQTVRFNVGFDYRQRWLSNVPKFAHVPAEAARASRTDDVATLDEAIELYMNAYRSHFSSQKSAATRERNLKRFARYLEFRGHSRRLCHLTTDDGQRFIDSLTHHFDGTPATRITKRRYRGALKSFSQFLYTAGLIEEDIFVELDI